MMRTRSDPSGCIEQALGDLDGLQARDAVAQRDAQLAGRGEGGESVHDVVLAEHPQAQRQALVACDDDAGGAG